MVIGPRPNAETVEALLDTTWRTAAAEWDRSDRLDNKAASLASFAAIVLSLTASFGPLERVEARDWLFFLFVGSVAALSLAVGFAVKVLLPKEHLLLGIAYLSRFSKWSELLKPPEQVRGETTAGLVSAVAHERRINHRKRSDVRLGYVLLLLGLVLVAAQASTIAARRYFA